MTGSGVGATYDQTRNVLWLLDQAKVDVAPDKKGGGAIHVTSKTAGMARNEHYMKFQGEARLEGQGHVIAGDDVTALPDRRRRADDAHGAARPLAHHRQAGGERPAGHARERHRPRVRGGRAHAAVGAARRERSVQLPGEKGKAGRRIAGKAIDIALAPDGSTVTNLAANENVQVDLPADGETPARRIRSASLLATGARRARASRRRPSPATSSFAKSRAARGKLAAVDRTAKSARMDLKTKPGFGDIEQASFHTNVRFTDGTQDDGGRADGRLRDRRRIGSTSVPATGDTGRGPHVSDGRISVEARSISMTLGDAGDEGRHATSAA